MCEWPNLSIQTQMGMLRKLRDRAGYDPDFVPTPGQQNGYSKTSFNKELRDAVLANKAIDCILQVVNRILDSGESGKGESFDWVLEAEIEGKVERLNASATNFYVSL